MSTAPGQPNPIAAHLSVGWEIAVVSTFAIVIIAVLTVVAWQSNREKIDLRGLELEDGTRSDSNCPASIKNKRKRRRKKARKAKARDPELATDGIDLEGEEIEEVESFVEDTDVGTGSVSGSEQYLDIPKPIQGGQINFVPEGLSNDQFRVGESITFNQHNCIW